MPSPKGTSPHGAKIVDAQAKRAEHARAAAYYAYRVELARAAGRSAEAAHWSEEYRRSVATCRLLGEIIRSGRSGSAAAGVPDSTVVPFAPPGRGDDVPATGEAA
jgi:hypothetical protein